MVYLGIIIMHNPSKTLFISFLSIADFGDFSRYDSQDFLQKFVLFPIVSLLFTVV